MSGGILWGLECDEFVVVVGGGGGGVVAVPVAQ